MREDWGEWGFFSQMKKLQELWISTAVELKKMSHLLEVFFCPFLVLVVELGDKWAERGTFLKILYFYIILVKIFNIKAKVGIA